MKKTEILLKCQINRSLLGYSLIGKLFAGQIQLINGSLIDILVRMIEGSQNKLLPK